jgi:hypothetical protein
MMSFPVVNSEIHPHNIVWMQEYCDSNSVGNPLGILY